MPAKKAAPPQHSQAVLVAALRSTWRKSAQHAAEQVKRFLRIFLFSAVPVVADLIVKGAGHFDWATLLFAIVPVGETAYRQVFPALGAAAVDEAPGAAIVVNQVADNLPATPDPLNASPEGDAAP